MNRIVRLRPALVLGCLVFLSCTHSAAQTAIGSQDTPPRIELNVNKVLVPVVVRDKQGRAVGDLKKEDFQVFDNDKPRLVSAFTVENRRATESNTASGQQMAVLANAAPQRFIVFLFDEMHLTAEDLAHAQKAAVKALDEALIGSDLAAVVSTSGTTNSGFTRDRTKLRDAIMSLRTRSLYRADGTDCPNTDYNLADLIENKHDNDALQKMILAVFSCHPEMNRQRDAGLAESLLHSADLRVLNLGRQDVRVTNSSIAEFVRRMAALPGQRILILASPGFPTIEPEARTAETRIIDLAVQSNVTINALDARGLYVAGPDPYAAQEDIMESLAYGTGGTFFHNSNDLDTGFKSLTEAPEVVYVLELSLDNIKPDGTYHRLNVKVDRDGFELQARRGYFMPKAEKSKK
jgi:VWFA-related protein